MKQNPFDKLGEISITLPQGMFAGFKLAQVRAFADRWNIKVKRDKGEWILTTDNPVNLFWFGCNVNNHHKEPPSALGEWVQIGMKIPHKDKLKLAGVKQYKTGTSEIMANGKLIVSFDEKDRQR